MMLLFNEEVLLFLFEVLWSPEGVLLLFPEKTLSPSLSGLLFFSVDVLLSFPGESLLLPIWIMMLLFNEEVLLFLFEVLLSPEGVLLLFAEKILSPSLSGLLFFSDDLLLSLPWDSLFLSISILLFLIDKEALLFLFEGPLSPEGVSLSLWVLDFWREAVTDPCRGVVTVPW